MEELQPGDYAITINEKNWHHNAFNQLVIINDSSIQSQIRYKFISRDIYWYGSTYYSPYSNFQKITYSNLLKLVML